MPAAAGRRRVRADMRPDGGRAVRDAGLPGRISDRVGREESSLREVACWATAVMAAGASAEPVLSTEGTAKIEAKAVLVVDEITRRQGHRSTVVTEVDTGAINLSEGAERPSILIYGPCAMKAVNTKYVAHVSENRPNLKK